MQGLDDRRKDAVAGRRIGEYSETGRRAMRIKYIYIVSDFLKC